MREHKEGARFCPFCGYEVNKSVEGYQLTPGILLENRYTLGTTIGVGGFGIIYKAWDNMLNTVVAIKECFPTGLCNRSPGRTGVNVVKNAEKEKLYREKITRFLSEARTMARFSEYENIVHVFDYFEANNTAYLVMEFLDGCSLKKYMEKHRLSVDESVDIACRICSILRHLHEEKIIHRDINLNNIMICRNGSVKLIDFGTARAQSGELSKALTAELTPGYAPPEQYMSNGFQGPWTDVYALCATLYHMLTCQKPEESTDRVMEDTLKHPMEINRDVPEWLDRAVMAGMATDYRLRIQNVDELLSALNQQSKARYPGERIRKHRIMSVLFAAAACAVILLTLGGIVVFNANYHAWNVEDGTVMVWAPDNSFGKGMEKAAEKFESRYSGKVIKLTLINEVSYSDLIMRAAEKGELPDVFLAPEQELDPEVYLADVTDILNEENDENHYLIMSNMEYLTESRVIPLSFNTVVLYENTSASGSIEDSYNLGYRMDLSEIKPSDDVRHTVFDRSSRLVGSVITPINGSEGIPDALAEFTDPDKQTIPYYFGSTGDRRAVQKALAGYNKIYGVSQGKTMYAEFSDELCVSKVPYESNKQLVDLWMEYLLSSDAQSCMYLENDMPLPVESDTYSHYIEIIKTLSFLAGEYKHFEIVSE